MTEENARKRKLIFPDDHLRVIDDPDGDCSSEQDVCESCGVTRREHDDEDHEFVD